MRSAAELHPVLGPSEWWIAAAFFIGLAAAVMLLWPLGARIYRAGLRSAGFAPVPAHVRHTYLGTVDEVAAAWRDGELSDRQVAHRLSGIVRDFAADAWDLSIRHMTLRELRAVRLGTVAAVVESLYEAEFARDEPGTAAALLEQVRGLITRWS